MSISIDLMLFMVWHYKGKIHNLKGCKQFVCQRCYLRDSLGLCLQFASLKSTHIAAFFAWIAVGFPDKLQQIVSIDLLRHIVSHFLFRRGKFDVFCSLTSSVSSPISAILALCRFRKSHCRWVIAHARAKYSGPGRAAATVGDAEDVPWVPTASRRGSEGSKRARRSR